MRYSRCVVPVVFLLLLAFACRKETPPEPPGPPPYLQSILLDTLSVDVTEVLLRVRAMDTTGAAAVALYRDSLLLFAGQPSLGDTTVLDTALAPATLHNYRAYLLQDSLRVDSASLGVRTMDTSSHSFFFYIDTLGDGSSSLLRDVAIIDENNVWAVGEVYLRDSIGQIDPSAYGFARWDGTSWRLFRLQAVGPTGLVSNLRPRGIFAFSANDIWFASGGVFHWDGQNVTPYWINAFPGNPNPILDPGQTAEKLWGTSSSDLYAVGQQGAIAHFDGSSWRQVLSGTTLPVNDIWGDTDPISGEQIVLCIASDTELLTGKLLLRIQDFAVTRMPETGLGQSLAGLWFLAGRRYFVVGEGLYTKRNVTDSTHWTSLQPGLTQYYMGKARGSGLSNIFVVGDYGSVLHFNGYSWQNFTSSTYLSDGFYVNVDIKRRFVVAVGLDNPRAVILRGYQQ